MLSAAWVLKEVTLVIGGTNRVPSSYGKFVKKDRKIFDTDLDQATIYYRGKLSSQRESTSVKLRIHT